MSTPDPDAGVRERSTTPLVAAVAAVVATVIAVAAVVVVVCGFWRPGFWVTRQLNVDKVQTGVRDVLTDDINGYGSTNVKDVTCNDGVNPPAEKGQAFDCAVTIDGAKRQVTVIIQDDSGTYDVGRPR